MAGLPQLLTFSKASRATEPWRRRPLWRTQDNLKRLVATSPLNRTHYSIRRDAEDAQRAQSDTQSHWEKVALNFFHKSKRTTPTAMKASATTVVMHAAAMPM
jgi:hypothetical protein